MKKKGENKNGENMIETGKEEKQQQKQKKRNFMSK